MTDTPWKDMTPEQRSARMAEGKRAKAAERAAIEAERPTIMAGLNQFDPLDADNTPEKEAAARMAEGKRAAALARSGNVPLADLPPGKPSETESRMEIGLLAGVVGLSDDKASDILGLTEVPKDLFGSVELSDDEVADIYARARVKVAEERKALKKAAMMDAALESARREAGLIIDKPKDIEAARLAELVPITIDLPEGGAPDGVRLDQQCFRHGLSYTVPRAVYETIIDIQNKAWIAEALFDGKAGNHYNRRRGRYEMAYGGGTPSGTRAYHAGA